MELRSIYEISSLNSTGQDIKAGVVFNIDHPVFKGHFPGNPVVPGVVQVQIMKDLLENVVQKKILLKNTRSIKYMNAIIPTETNEVVFEINYEGQSPGSYAVKCSVWCADKVFMKFLGSVMVEE